MGYRHSIASNLSMVFAPPFFFVKRNKLLTNSPFDGWIPLLIVDGSFLQNFFYLQFYQIFPFSTHYWLGRNFWLKRFWMKWNFACFYCVQKFGISAMLIQAPAKSFNLPANGTFEIFFDKYNLFISGWIFLHSHWIWFSGFKSMLKNVCCGAVISLWRCCCCSFLLLWNFFDLVLIRKNFCLSLFLSAGERLNEKDFLCSIKISLVSFSDLMVSAILFLSFFFEFLRNWHLFF